MATQLLSLPAYFSGDADFRTWGKGLSDAIAATGLVKAADTGQIDWTTVARPGASAYAGYEIWRFTDALQATLPVFIKLEYGVGSAVDRPSLAVTVGAGTNGAGSINSQTGTRTLLAANASRVIGDKLTSFIYGNGRGLVLVTNLDPTSNSFVIGIVVGRTIDGAGTPTGEGIFTYSWRSASSYQVIPIAGSVPAVDSGLPVPKTRGHLSSVGTDVALGVPVVMLGKIRYCELILTYEHADIGELSAISANNFGAAHTYMPLGDGAGGGSLHGVGTAVTVAMLWE
jgi:hypothetical protein